MNVTFHARRLCSRTAASFSAHSGVSGLSCRVTALLPYRFTALPLCARAARACAETRRLDGVPSPFFSVPFSRLRLSNSIVGSGNQRQGKRENGPETQSDKVGQRPGWGCCGQVDYSATGRSQASQTRPLAATHFPGQQVQPTQTRLQHAPPFSHPLAVPPFQIVSLCLLRMINKPDCRLPLSAASHVERSLCLANSAPDKNCAR